MRRRALLTSLSAAAVVGLAGCSRSDADEERTPEGTEPTTTTETDATAAAPASVTLADRRLVRSNRDTTDELVSVVGTARNDGESALADLSAVARFLNADGEEVGTADAELNELAPGKRWQFSLVFPGSGEKARSVERYRLRIDAGE
ncbi:FxLYD domain-containing protein [Halopelagius longus]|uniref:DUF3426 domain-containing protein n=1 Tax=Halopelagius longus TaxID=1236180 RepID=A0A1H1ERA9_9EURY|nr:FxLYD domain-containing protein [Halopelagius longus]RDI71851.1 hypothetical protein DWB78_09010 [Halopelagius longus]SDQ91039.1 hypothetical protein SAMN05216278_3019 [Halopelagius longus]